MKALITDFGAIANGITLNTESIQNAIEACRQTGGGTVVIPPGRFLSGTLKLYSHVNLHLEAGSMLIGSSCLDDYYHSGFVHPDNYFSQVEQGKSLSLIFANKAENVSINGSGTINLSSDAFFNFNAIKPIRGIDENELTPEQWKEASVPKIAGPTQPIFFNQCIGVEISGVKIINSPSLTINLNACSDVRIHHTTIRNNLRVPISDGIHICGSKDVIISDNLIICGDDCVAITGVTNWGGVSERIIITNCSMQSKSAAVRVGFMASKVRDVLISNLTIHDTNRGFAIFAGDDGWVENVSIQNIVMQTQMFAGDWWGKGEPLVICAAQSQGHIRHIQIRGVAARAENGIILVGDSQNIQNIVLEDWTLELSQGKNHALFHGIIDLQPAASLQRTTTFSPCLYASEIQDLQVTNMSYRAPQNNEQKSSPEPLIENSNRVKLQNVKEIH